MSNQPIDDDMPAEIDFTKGTMGLHDIPAGAKVLMPVSIEMGVWRYFSGKAEQRGIGFVRAGDRSAEAGYGDW